MAEILQKTMTHGSFESVFTEVTHQESINCSSHSQVRLFYLSSIEDRAFDTNSLVKLLRRNLGQYFFSRGEIDEFKEDGDEYSIGLEAAAGLRTFDYSRIFEEIMICYLLEDRLNAPKLMSRPEIRSASGRYEGCSDSIHILSLGDTNDIVRFQMIFGTAKVHTFIDEALDDIFEKIAAISNSKQNERALVDSTLFGKHFNKETTAYLTQILTPSKGNNGKRTISENAYGVFVGYKLNLRADNRSSDQFLSSIDDKMIQDIRHYAPLIRQRITDAGLDQNPFYFFFIPLNDAENEKTSIVEAILR